ncbi:class I SAM-dependent methyltransferase [Pendulispora rubella]|uniref:Class I SAM-dependent methyltransferase n=1 Tax=Pendulispora rubella TaxID=2741070 RepID=A0ABZ2L7P3_9BACT
MRARVSERAADRGSVPGRFRLAGPTVRAARVSALRPAEKTILERLDVELPSMTMLDLAVGGGRTTEHFAPRVKRYIALDDSPATLRAWSKRFSGAPYEFLLGDARTLPFNDHTFDFVLFAHNGIDYVDRDGRLRALREVRRVARAGGTFVFSTHDLERCAPVLAPRAAAYHLWLSEQLAQLHQAGFERVRAYSATTGAEIVSLAHECPPDRWLYFLCRAASA